MYGLLSKEDGEDILIVAVGDSTGKRVLVSVAKLRSARCGKLLLSLSIGYGYPNRWVICMLDSVRSIHRRRSK